MTSLLIIGASVRAAAHSALRAGLRPYAIDLFGDRDLLAVCPATVVRPGRYPRDLVELARQAPSGPWMYTGALENYPDIVEQISRERPLWGNDAACLRRVRDPFALAAALRAVDVPCPVVRAAGDETLGKRWLLKPVASAGGAGVRFASESRREPRRPAYLQEFIDGESHAAVFVADTDGCSLLGVTKQLVGSRWLHAPAFRYAGSIGSLDLSAAERTAWERLGLAVTRFASLRGLFGIDAIIRDNVPWPVEVNPRYTASVEVLEFAMGIRAIEMHRPCHGRETVPQQQGSPNVVVGSPDPTTRRIIGKFIWYAPRALRIPVGGPWEDVASETPPAFADIPPSGQRIAKGRPVMTLFAVGDTIDECERKLREVAETLPCS